MKILRETPIVSVIGGNDPPESDMATAYQVGRHLALNGAIVVCGGLGGVMEAVCKGAKEAGGTTIGILPGNDSSDANPYVDIRIPTGLGHARNVIVVKSGIAVIAIDGSYGTLSEIGHALSDRIPVIGLNTWKFSHGQNRSTGMMEANTAAEAVEIALSPRRPDENKSEVEGSHE